MTRQIISQCPESVGSGRENEFRFRRSLAGSFEERKNRKAKRQKESEIMTIIKFSHLLFPRTDLNLKIVSLDDRPRKSFFFFIFSVLLPSSTKIFIIQLYHQATPGFYTLECGHIVWCPDAGRSLLRTL